MSPRTGPITSSTSWSPTRWTCTSTSRTTSTTTHSCPWARWEITLGEGRKLLCYLCTKIYYSKFVKADKCIKQTWKYGNKTNPIGQTKMLVHLSKKYNLWSEEKSLLICWDKNHFWTLAEGLGQINVYIYTFVPHTRTSRYRNFPCPGSWMECLWPAIYNTRESVMVIVHNSVERNRWSEAMSAERKWLKLYNE